MQKGTQTIVENWYRDDNNGIRIGKDKEFLRVLCGASEKTYADTLPNRIKVLREIQRIQGKETLAIQQGRWCSAAGVGITVLLFLGNSLLRRHSRKKRSTAPCN